MNWVPVYMLQISMSIVKCRYDGRCESEQNLLTASKIQMETCSNSKRNGSLLVPIAKREFKDKTFLYNPETGFTYRHMEFCWKDQAITDINVAVSDNGNCL